MLLNSKFALLFLILFSFNKFSAQVNLKKEDSTKVYTKIEKYSAKRKFTKFIHQIIFEPVVITKVKETNIKKPKKVNYNKFECKIIRKITVETLDPFGYSEIDSMKRPRLFRDKLGNSLHYKTRKFTISNLLLYKKNTELDSLLIKESERLVRAQDYVRGVQTFVKLTSKQSDSVDVIIRVLDLWSIIPDFNTSSTTSTFRITEKNVLGLGHEFSNTLRKNLTAGNNAYSSSYSIPSLFRTYIRTTLSYDIDVDGKYVKFINIERPFFSAFTQWAGGAYFDQSYRKSIMLDAQQVPHEETIKFNQQDYWFGRSFWLFDGKSERSRSTRLITLLRFLNRKYTERPEYQFDSLNYYSSEKFYFASIGLSSRKYTQERYLFKFNVTEDVPSGFVYNLIGGYQQKNNINRYYLGGQFSIGRYYDFGYLGGKIELGSFFHRKITEQTGFVGTITYFTPLIETGGWKFRQFVKPILVLGNNRLEASYDQLNLNGMNGIQGFSTTPDSGTKKATLNLQTQGYSPWNVYGFRINPYLSYTLGILGNKEHGFCNSKVYSQYGLGFIISNDFFVFNSFQVSFSYYPTIPGFADDVIKTNSFKTSDFGLPNFEITKPSIVPYQ